MLEFTGLTAFQEDPPIVEIDLASAQKAEIRLFLKREDKIHERLSGNKWRKLKYNLIEARKAGKKSLLTFGGAYSNHIAAVAEAGNIFNFKTTAIIRGEKPILLNHTLLKAQENGMEFVFVSRTIYRDKTLLLSSLDFDRSDTYVIPEGGTNALALKGCREIITDCNFEKPIDYWCVACGTGGTAAGIISALRPKEQAIGFSVLKGNFMKQEIKDLLVNENIGEKKWQVNNEYHFGGYAKFTPELIDFINDFKQQYKIALDPIYTSKLLFGVFDLIEKGYFPKGSNLMLVHTGGQQGISGFNERFGNLIQ